jgi:hypothetical protein
MLDPNYTAFHHARELTRSSTLSDLEDRLLPTPPTSPTTSPSEPAIYIDQHVRATTVIAGASKHFFSSGGLTKPRQWSLVLGGERPFHPHALAANDPVVLAHSSIRASQATFRGTAFVLAQGTPVTAPAYAWAINVLANPPILKHASVERFRHLARQWRQTRTSTGSMLEICSNSAYLQIIGMGQDAMPLVLRDLEHSGDDWFFALAAITGKNPVQEQHRGRRSLMAQDWLRWAKQQGYRW